MYAVIETGGKQYRVAVGDSLRVEKLEQEEGSEVILTRVLMVGNGESMQVGKPLLDGAQVTAIVNAQARGDKIRIFKMRRRKHYRKRQGHRQHFTELKITGINV